MARKLLWAVPLLFVGVLFYWPLAEILGLGLSSASDLAESFEPQVFEVIWFTVWQATLSTLICLVLGVPGAYLLYRKSFRARNLLRSVITVPFVLPTIVVAIGFTAFRNEHKFYSDFGIDWPYTNLVYWIVVAHVFMNYSLVVRSLGSLWSTLDAETEEAAQLAGAGRLRTVWSIVLPQLKPALVSSAALVFLFSSTSFGIVLVLGAGEVNSIETEIYSAATQFLDLPKASLLALIQIALTVLAFLVSERFSKGAVSIELTEDSNRLPALDRRDWPAILVSAFVILAVIVLPLLLVLRKAFEVGAGADLRFGFDNFVNLLGRGPRDLLNITVLDAGLNSLRNLLVSASIAVVLGVLVSYLLARRAKRAAALDLVFLMPIGVSSVVLGFGYLISFGGGPLPLRASWLVVPLVQSLIALPIVIRLVYPALIAIDSEVTDAARTDGASTWQLATLIELPMIGAVLRTAMGFAAIVSIGEFGAAALLAYGDQATLPTVLYRLISRPGAESYGMAMATSAILIVLTIAVITALSLRRTQRQAS